MFVLDSSETDCRTINWLMCVVFVLFLMTNNMLIVCK